MHMENGALLRSAEKKDVGGVLLREGGGVGCFIAGVNNISALDLRY